MAVLSVQSVTESGLNPSLAAAAAGGDSFPNSTDERTFFVVSNASAAAVTVTVTAQDASVKVPGYGNMSKADASVSVPAGGERWIGPFPAAAYNDANGRVAVGYSAVTSVTVAAVKVPKQ